MRLRSGQQQIGKFPIRLRRWLCRSARRPAGFLPLPPRLSRLPQQRDLRMRKPAPLHAVLVAMATAGAATVLATSGAGAAQAAATPLPAHVFAPYFESYNGDSP